MFGIFSLMFLGLGGFFWFVLFDSSHNLGERRTGDYTAAMETGALSMVQESACQVLWKDKRIISALKTSDFSGS